MVSKLFAWPASGGMMDRFTRNYSIALGIILSVFLLWALYEDPLVGELNGLLEQDSAVAVYPYRFQVLTVHDGVATMGTPRSSDFPVQRALGILFPALANRAQDDPDLMRAQQDLAQVQKRAMAIVLESGKVKRVRWELDRDWLSRHGVQFGLSPR